MFLVVPRFGTISPWSSKASDIARNCGLAKIDRLERGIAYYVQANCPRNDAQQVAARLHDRMTQLVLDRLEGAAELFSHAQPRPLTAVDVLAAVAPRWRRPTSSWPGPRPRTRSTTC